MVFLATKKFWVGSFFDLTLPMVRRVDGLSRIHWIDYACLPLTAGIGQSAPRNAKPRTEALTQMINKVNLSLGFDQNVITSS